MSIELLQDAKRADGWWLLVDGAEQSYVDTSDPLHLEFEYVQMIEHLLESLFVQPAPVSVLHLGGGLCTVARLLATRHPGSRQRVVEHSKEIARLSASLGRPPGVTVVVAEAQAVVTRARRHSADLVVCDVYEGPETVTDLFTLGVVQQVRSVLRADGVYICNLSDAAPFALSKVVAATLRAVFTSVVLLAEPPVLRGRRSGNLVLAATGRDLPITELSRRAAGGAVRVRVVADEDLSSFIGAAAPARLDSELPRSGESSGVSFR